MTFSDRYVRRLVIPPALLSVPLGLLFLTQVVRPTPAQFLVLLAVVAGFYLAGGLAFGFAMKAATTRVEQALEKGDAVSEEISRCLELTKSVATLIWLGGGIVFAIAGTLIILPTFLGFSYFLVASLIAAAFGIPWAYVAAKDVLVEAADGRPARYTGRRFTLGRKIAIAFIGLFIVSSATLVQLVSSRVATTLERLAISSERERFDRMVSTANLSATIDDSLVSTVKHYVPADHSVHRITRDGKISSSRDTLPPDDIERILTIRSGDSSSFISPNVLLFAPLEDGSILVLGIPWTPYKDIPRQITFYTLVVALLTSLLFSAAAYAVARDVTRPVATLMAEAGEMATGNFGVQSHVFSDDEVGVLADRFGQTRENLRGLISKVGGSGRTVTEGVRVISEGTESLLERANRQSELTGNSSQTLESVRQNIESVLSAADKVSTHTEDSSSRAVELQASTEAVAGSVDFLFQSVEQTSASTLQMAATASEMSNRTAGLAAITEQVLSFVTEMDATNDELRQNAEATAGISLRVREDAVAGGAAVDETVSGIQLSQQSSERAAATIDSLQTSVGKISQILRVIEEITERTNLLALNAAIIAAQAGEHGLGFTVVADEIRELAERTRGSTKEIAGIIKAVQSGSRDAVAAMHEGLKRVQDNAAVAERASSSLRKIVESAVQSNEMATKISRSLVEQSQASRHLHEVTSRMSDHIAENNRAIQEQARGTQLLATEADRVREIALQVKNSTEQQSIAGRGIAAAMEQIAGDARGIRDLIGRQLGESEQIADVSKTLRVIARQNEELAQDFNATVTKLLESGRDFETEVRKFRFQE